jgi:hypothetical protein
MASAPIWVRDFTRVATPDIDNLASAEFRKVNFTDFFGQFLQQGKNTGLETFDQLVTVFWNESKTSPHTLDIETFAVADGAFIDQKTVPGNWFKPHLRFITVVTPVKSGDWQVFIVGPDDVKAPNQFLQVASWDGKVFRFYAFDDINDPMQSSNSQGWVYQGNSFGAFGDKDTPDTVYLGPFNGHVNGALIMKERRSPWYHWKSGENTNFLNCISHEMQTMLEAIPYLTSPGGACLSRVEDAPGFQQLVENGVSNWYDTRLSSDFADPSSGKPLTNPTNVQRWMAHLLLTTTVNFATSSNNGFTYNADENLFFNYELLASSTASDLNLLPDLSTFNFQFDYNQYKSARAQLRLSLLQEVRDSDSLPKDFPHIILRPGTLGGGKQTDSHDVVNFIEVSPSNEGVPFVILQSSYEDAQGILNMRQVGNIGDNFPISLISDKCMRAILMLDFWNPLYSWKRGLLMQYVPGKTTLDSSSNTYDLEPNFVAAVRASSHATGNVLDSPEYQFLQLYDGPDDINQYQTRISQYLAAVNDRLGTAEGIVDYLSLAESRKRIYRPLPLDEFGIQLPYAVNLPTDWQYIEMTEAGTTTTIPERGMAFLNTWTGSLAGYNPDILPANELPGSIPRASMAVGRCPIMKSRRGPTRDQPAIPATVTAAAAAAVAVAASRETIPDGSSATTISPLSSTHSIGSRTHLV